MRVAVVPARGGSKRIPRKNVRPFHGRPMIAWPLDAALRSGLFDRVIVSTDDDEVAACSRAAGAEVPFARPAELATDHTPTADVIAHAIDWLRASGEDPSAVCCLYATAPFVLPEDLAEGLRLLESGDWDYAFSATDYPSPVFRAFLEDPAGGVRMLHPEHFASRSQDLPEVLHDAAQFYWGRPAAWCERRVVFSERSQVVRIPRWRVQDIDTPDDWKRAELLAPALLGE